MDTPFRERAPDLDGHDPAALADAARVAADDVTFGDGPFLLDPVPRVIPAEDWADLEAGLLQRVRALDAFCADVYGERRIVRDGVMPARVVETTDTLEPALCGTSLDRWVGIAGLDVVRAPDGRFLVLEDNLRTPSGMAYAVAARVMTLMLWQPEVEPAPVDGLREMLRLALGEGRAVVLTDGPSNTAYWEHEWLAELLEIPLVEPSGLDPARIDVVYRRTNAWQFDSDVGRLLHGRVRVVNAYGIGVGDDKLAHAYVEDMVRYYLGEEPLVGSVRTYDLGRPEVVAEALDRIEELVIKPRAGYGGKGVVICPHASREDVERVREDVRAAPEDFIAQELVPLSEHATVIDGSVVMRHVDLRPFVFLGAGDEGRVYPGGLTRVALDEGALVVNSSQNGGAKDTWVV
ncbi:MAG TPA: circularly permuted type 2 ATP-grasp protein [Solirubrobacteraceae bacterium]|nr:circularly permuted type 2 ATP-grasp protein [Solirubrobacteraceae bacterium]